MSARVLSVNTGRIRPFAFRGETKASAIWKSPVERRVRIESLGLEGDEHAEKGTHGGADQAVYAYTREDYAFWEAELGRNLEPGEFGENLTLQGLDLGSVRVGQRVHVGGAILEATQPRIPCWKFQHRMGEDRWIERFNAALRPGAYFRVVSPGSVSRGDAVEPMVASDAAPTIVDLFRIRTAEPGRAHELLACRDLSEKWRRWAQSAAARATGSSATG